VSEETRSFGNLSLQYGADGDVSCCAYDYDPPILVISAGETSVSVSARGRRSSPGYAVEFARKLAKAAQIYLAECERFDQARGQLPPRRATTAAGDPAA
jgi:hypothetical protein